MYADTSRGDSSVPFGSDKKVVVREKSKYHMEKWLLN